MVGRKRRSLPPKILILESLEEEGRIYESKLKEILENVFGEFSQSRLNSEMMKLETEGLIVVSESGSRKGKIIELSKGKRYIQIGEE